MDESIFHSPWISTRCWFPHFIQRKLFVYLFPLLGTLTVLVLLLVVPHFSHLFL